MNYKKLTKLDNLDLLELVCQLNVRFSHNPTKKIYETYREARRELERRIGNNSPTLNPTDRLTLNPTK